MDLYLEVLEDLENGVFSIPFYYKGIYKRVFLFNIYALFLKIHRYKSQGKLIWGYNKEITNAVINTLILMKKANISNNDYIEEILEYLLIIAFDRNFIN